MLGATQTKIKKLPCSKENKNSKKVISVKCGLRQPKIIKSKVSNAAVGKRHLKNRNNSTSKAHNRNTISEKLRRCTSKMDVLSKKNTPRSELNTHARANAQIKISGKKNSLKTKTIAIYSKDINKSCSSTNPLFVCLDSTDEKKYKSKFRKLTSARKLKRLRENLWKKSSYHKRFLGKSGNVKSRKSEKIKAVKNEKKQLPSKQDNILQKSEIKNSTDIPTEAKNLEQNIPKIKPSNQDYLSTKTEGSLNLEISLSDSKKPSKYDVSMIDEKFIKSLLSIANCGNKPEKVAMEHLSKDFYSKATKTNCKMKISGKEFFVNKMKTKKTAELSHKNAEDKTSLDVCNRKSQQNLTKEKTDLAKSETEIKPWKRKTTDTKNKEVKNKPKKAYSKQEINGLQQKKKTRNIVKNKKEDKIEIPFPCDVLKVEEIQELWKRENSAKHRISRSSESSSTIAENSNNQNVQNLGLESYQELKKFVAEEVYRISKRYKKNDLPKNDAKETCKDRNATPNEKQISNYIRKKLAVKGRESFLQGEKQLRNAETLKCVNLSHRGKPQSVKSKLKLLEEKKSSVKKIPDEVIKNWSIVNRLEQAFLALGTPNFRKAKEKEPAIKNSKVTRTIPRFTAEVKRVEKKIKDGEKKKLKSATRIAFYKQKVNEVNKTNKKQVRVIHKKESITSDHKPATTSSASSTQSSKIEDKAKSLEEKARLQPQSLAPFCKPSIKPTARFANKSGIKPPTPVENLCSSWNKIVGYQQTGKVGKKNSPRNHLCESSTQNKHDDNLERKKTFQVISLKDSVIMQPRRSKSNLKAVKKGSLSPTRSPECKSVTYLKEQDPKFSEKENIKTNMLKNKTVETEQPASKSKNFDQISREEVKDSPTSTPNEDIKRRPTPPKEIPEQARVTKDMNSSGKTRAIKERSILSIRRNQHENQTSRADISQIQEECSPIKFKEDTSTLSEATKVNVFLPPTKTNPSESSCGSLSTFDLTTSKSSVENSSQIITIDDGLKLLKAPSMSPSRSTQMTASQTSTESKGKPKIISALWEQDINYYRALVKDIMSQHKRLGGFLKQGENVKTLSEDLEELNSSEVLKEKIRIQEYRKKIMTEYQEVPLMEYKSKMKQEKMEGRWKRRNLLVIQPVNGEIDLDVKDYEPRMRTVLGSRLYFDKENFRQSQETSRNLTERKLSLQGVTVSKCTNRKNCSVAISVPKSC